MTEEAIIRTGEMEWRFVVRLKFDDVRNRSSARGCGRWVAHRVRAMPREGSGQVHRIESKGSALRP